MSPRDALKQLLIRFAIKSNKITLSSGRISDYFIEPRRVTLTAAGAHLIGLAYLDRFKELELCVDVVGGMETAAPIAISISAASYATRKEIQTFLIKRKVVFGGGTRLWVDGFRSGEVVLVEDLTTSGNSTVDSLTKAAEVGINVKAVVTLIDREEGSAGRVKSICPFYRIFTAQELFAGFGKHASKPSSLPL